MQIKKKTQQIQKPENYLSEFTCIHELNKFGQTQINYAVLYQKVMTAPIKCKADYACRLAIYDDESGKCFLHTVLDKGSGVEAKKNKIIRIIK